MQKQLSELRKIIDNKHRLTGISNYAYADLDEVITQMEVLISREIKSEKFIELIDDGFTTLIKRKSIFKIGFRKDDFSNVYFSYKNGHDETLLLKVNTYSNIFYNYF